MSALPEREFTIAELVTKLADLPPNATVILEGCDCYGEWNGEFRTEVDQNGQRSVVLCRYGGVGEQ